MKLSKGDVSKIVSNCPDGDVSGRLTWVLLGLVGIALLQPFRIWPFSTLIEDFFLGLGVVFLSGVMIVLRKRYWLSSLLLVWLGFGGILLVSALLVPRVFEAGLFAYAGFWLVGLALTQLGPESSWRIGSQLFALRLAWFLLLVGVFSAILGCVKYYQLWGDIGLYLPQVRGGRMNGVIGQSNLFAVICLLGLMSLLWLISIKKVAIYWCVALGGILLFAVVLSGSRVVGLIYCASLVVAIIQAWSTRDYRFSGFMIGAGILFIILFLPVLDFDPLLREWLVKFGYSNNHYVAENVFERGMASARWVEWPLALQILWENLILGIGPGAYAEHSYAIHLRESALPLQNVWLHSHNSYLQLWVEFGLLGVLWTLAMGCLVVSVLWRAVQFNQPVQAMVMLALLIYSFFEFPLWFMHFFVLGFWVLSAGSEARAIPGKPLLGGLVALIAGFALLFYGSLFAGLLEFHVKRASGVGVPSAGLGFVDRLVQDPLLKPYGLQFYYYNFDVGSLPLNLELKELDGLRRYFPYPLNSYRYSILLAAAGRSEEAIKVRDETFRAFPSSKEHYFNFVEGAMKDHPDWKLMPLLNGL